MVIEYRLVIEMQPKKRCYEHIAGIVGIKTDIPGFRWGFGRCESPVSEKVFENCKIKVYLEAKKDSEVFNDIRTDCFTEIFRDFRVNPDSESLFFEKKVANLVNLKFAVSINGNSVNAVVGKSYLKYVKAKMMYIHSIAYILFDVVSMLLLKNGMTTLYCSAARLQNGKNVVFIAPPNTGKSLTVLKLRNDFNADIITEDMAVTDGERIWGAPYTNLYRNYNDKSLKNPIQNAEIPTGKKIDAVSVLQKCKGSSIEENTDFAKKTVLINRYSLGYYYSPVVRVLDYYYNDYSIEKAQQTEKELIERILNNSKVFFLRDENPMNFASSVCDISL